MTNSNKTISGQFLTSQPTLDEIKSYFKGKGGGPDGESHIIDSNYDKKQGFVWVYSTTKDVAKIIDRCANGVLDYRFLDAEGIQLKIDRKYFRGIHCAFRSVKEK